MSNNPSSHLRQPARQARLLARLARAAEWSCDHSAASRNIRGYLSTAAQGKRSQRTRWSFDHSAASSAGVAEGCDECSGQDIGQD